MDVLCRTFHVLQVRESSRQTNPQTFGQSARLPRPMTEGLAFRKLRRYFPKKRRRIVKRLAYRPQDERRLDPALRHVQTRSDRALLTRH